MSETEIHRFGLSDPQDTEVVRYRAVSGLAVGGLVIALFSPIALAHPVLWTVPVIGIVTCVGLGYVASLPFRRPLPANSVLTVHDLKKTAARE